MVQKGWLAFVRNEIKLQAYIPSRR